MKNATLIEHVAVNSSQYNKARKGNIQNVGWKEMNKTVPICR